MTPADEFQTWLERRGCYSHSSIETWVRIARRLVEACPDGIYPVTPEDAADLLAPAACMPHTRYNLRSGMRQFYEFWGRRSEMVATLVIAVDFDGVICAENYPQIGPPCMPIVASLKRVRAAGHRLVLNTCREGDLLTDAVRFCESLGLSFDAVNENLSDRILHYGGDCRKIGADLYIDDRVPGFSVEETVRYLQRLCEEVV